MIMLPVFFALVKPASTIANPACIQNTRAAPIKNQTPNTWSLITLKISSVIKIPPCLIGFLRLRSVFLYSPSRAYLPAKNRIKTKKRQSK